MHVERRSRERPSRLEVVSGWYQRDGARERVPQPWFRLWSQLPRDKRHLQRNPAKDRRHPVRLYRGRPGGLRGRRWADGLVHAGVTCLAQLERAGQEPLLVPDERAEGRGGWQLRPSQLEEVGEDRSPILASREPLRRPCCMTVAVLAPGHPPDRRPSEPRKIAVKGARRASRVNAA